MRHAIFTIVQEEPFFWPIWYRYYRRHFKPCHMYVLYHPLPGEDGTRPGTMLPVTAFANMVRVYHDRSFDHTWLRGQVEKFAAFLLGSYSTVTFTEIDEIIAVDPVRAAAKGRSTNLGDWLDAWWWYEQSAARCTGYEVVHRYDEEPDLDDRPSARDADSRILKDRGWWYPSDIYSKTLTWRVPPRWCNGFHEAYNYFPGPGGEHARLDLPKEPDLMLLHLHKVDYKAAVARWKATKARTWNRADTRGRIGIQNRFDNEEQLRWWWYRSIDEPAARAGLVSMPDAVKTIV